MDRSGRGFRMIAVTARRILVGSSLLILLAVLWVGQRAIHVLFPNFWLPTNAEVVQQGPVRRVNPHLYDSEWFDAARAGRTDISDALLKAGFPVNSRTGQGFTALVLATYHGDNDEVDLLLQAGADPCIADNSGNTALMGALFKGHLKVARRLLDLCPIELTNNTGQTALSFAALFGRLDILKDLVSKGANPEHLDANSQTAMMIVQQQGNDSAVRALLALGAKR